MNALEGMGTIGHSHLSILEMPRSRNNALHHLYPTRVRNSHRSDGWVMASTFLCKDNMFLKECVHFRLGDHHIGGMRSQKADSKFNIETRH